MALSSVLKQDIALSGEGAEISDTLLRNLGGRGGNLDPGEVDCSGAGVV